MHVSTDHLVAQAWERFALQDYYGAIHLLVDVIDGGREYADVHHLLGLCWSLLGQDSRALAAFDRALELNPRYLEAHVHRGLVLNALGRTDDAREAFQAAAVERRPAVAGLPADVAARLANAHAELGEACADAGALDRAIEQFRTACELGPTFPDLRYRLGRLLLEAGRTLEAREELERVVVERPSFVDAQATLGLARYLSGDAGGAEEVWRACLAARPENARVEAYLAMLDRNPR